jgi:hypothetical protein
MMDTYNEKGAEKNGVQVEPFNSNVESGSVGAGVASEEGIKPRLEERHIQMIAIAGVIVCHCYVYSSKVTKRRRLDIASNMPSRARVCSLAPEPPYRKQALSALCLAIWLWDWSRHVSRGLQAKCPHSCPLLEASHDTLLEWSSPRLVRPLDGTFVSPSLRT